jgi:hypothetical protein
MSLISWKCNSCEGVYIRYTSEGPCIFCNSQNVVLVEEPLFSSGVTPQETRDIEKLERDIISTVPDGVDLWNRADQAIETAYPRMEGALGNWGAQPIPNWGLLRAAIVRELSKVSTEAFQCGLNQVKK